MSRWTKENLERVSREYLGPEDDSPQARKRARILAAATRLFMERGYRATSIDEVARAARIAKGTVYLYFRSKADLLVHAVALEKKVLGSRLEPLLTGAIEPRARLRTYLGVVLASMTDLPLVTKLMTGDAELLDALVELGGEADRQRAESRAWMAELIELAAPGELDEAERDARAEVLVGVLFCAVSLLSEHARGPVPLERYRETLADVLAAGLAHAPARAPTTRGAGDGPATKRGGGGR
jgi:TetR/AcrR family fatty acid metabolism transcriptional regulator